MLRLGRKRKSRQLTPENAEWLLHIIAVLGMVQTELENPPG
jgi:hypothetical protein